MTETGAALSIENVEGEARIVWLLGFNSHWGMVSQFVHDAKSDINHRRSLA